MKNACFTLLLFSWLSTWVVPAQPPLTAANPGAPRMLSGAWLPEDSHRIDFASLPQVPSEHAILSDVRDKDAVRDEVNKESGGVNQHNYLVYYGGQFWAM